MAATHFSGPLVVTGSNGALQTTALLTADLPAAADNTGMVAVISDNGAGDDETCLVISNGTAWVTAVGAALS